MLAHTELLLLLACLFGFFMAWGVGANDVANAMGTSVGSKAITLKQAVIIAAIFEAAGALLAGGQVTNTIRKGILHTDVYHLSPDLLIYGMLAALLASGVWLLIASSRSWPVSTTHSIVGAIIGFGVITLGWHAIYWSTVIKIALSWIVTPIIAGVIAFLLFHSIQKWILGRADPFKRATQLLPYYIFFVTLIVALITLTQGIKHIGLQPSPLLTGVMVLSLSLLMFFSSRWYLKRAHIRMPKTDESPFKQVEKIFGLLMVFTASSMAFSHGANDVANAIGPLAAVVSLLKSPPTLSAQAPLPLWVLMLGAGGIIIGLATYGYKVIATIGEHITDLTPSRGFAAELATTTTVILASGTGLPISTTQTLVGAILGVGFARGIGAINLQVIRNIFMSWTITLPVGAALSVCFFYLLSGLAKIGWL